MRAVTAVLLGAGDRGRNAYAPYALAHPEALRFVAVAEPDVERRTQFQKQHGLPDAACYQDYQAFFQNPVPADCLLVCTQDRMHTEPALMALERGYQVLLEKPMSPIRDECEKLVETASVNHRVLMVCHVLRYTPFYSTLKQLLDQGAIGRLISVHHLEGVGYWHFAHSFVRGNWSVEAQSAPAILAKTCHDLDILQWLIGGRCTSVSSAGALTYFTAENAPEGAPARCLEDCPHARTCLYYAPDLYLGESTEWPTSAISADASLEARREALRSGPYGRCVFRCDNDVCDHQSVNLSFDNGVVANMMSTAFTNDINRWTTLQGTEGDIDANFHAATIRVRQHGSGRVDEIKLNLDLDNLGHGGGDFRLLRDFLDVVRDGSGEARTLAEVSLASHLMAFAAEGSRKTGRAVQL